jgi:hypothetical protein
VRPRKRRLTQRPVLRSTTAEGGQNCGGWTPRGKDAKGDGGEDVLESLTQRVELPRNRNLCVLAPLRHCVAATAFFRSNGTMSRSMASSQEAEACGLAVRSRKCPLGAGTAAGLGLPA